MSLAWIPYASGRSATPPADRPLGGILMAALVPLVLAAALGLAVAELQAIVLPALPEPVHSTPSFLTSSLPLLPPQFTPSVQHWSAQIYRWADDHKLPATWVAVVMQIESCGHPRIRSRAGAAGLFQVMPFHFRDGEDPLDASTNAERGLEYLARAYTLSSGDPALTLAGYNGGHGMMNRPRALWPDETQRYVKWGTGILDDVAAGLTPSPTLTQWLEAGGSGLCRKASEALALEAAAPVAASLR